ncbi:hypothetical protein KC901_01280 [Patescibacteria group bacterium]|nr:hypothetical protein [Patescibacteria group bacterium]
MKHNTAFPKFKKHLAVFIKLSLLVFLAMFFFSLLQLVFDRSTMFFDTVLPHIINYLGLFISLMMLIMGITYLRFLRYHN